MNITNIKTNIINTKDYTATITRAETTNSNIEHYEYKKPHHICRAYIISKLLPNNGFNTITNIWDLVKNN